MSLRVGRLYEFCPLDETQYIWGIKQACRDFVDTETGAAVSFRRNFVLGRRADGTSATAEAQQWVTDHVVCATHGIRPETWATSVTRHSRLMDRFHQHWWRNLNGWERRRPPVVSVRTTWLAALPNARVAV